MEKKIHKELPEDIRYIANSDQEFPEKLKELHDCSKGIYVRGKLPDPGTPDHCLLYNVCLPSILYESFFPSLHRPKFPVYISVTDCL